MTIEHVYQLVIDFDKSRGSYFHELILGIVLRPSLLASLALTDHFLSRANMPPVLLASNQQVLLIQNRPPVREDQLVNQERSTCGPSAIDVKDIDTLSASTRVKPRPS